MVKVIEPSFEILTPLDGRQILKHIERCGRTCYQSFDKADDTSWERFSLHIVERHHESVIEHVSISVKFITDRAIAIEIVSHNKFQGEISVIKPVELDPASKAYQYWFDGMLEIEKTYMKLIELGEKPETARAVLPCCLKTELVVTANLREWRHIFDLRCSPAAHPDVRVLMCGLRDAFRREIPVLFEEA